MKVNLIQAFLRNCCITFGSLFIVLFLGHLTAPLLAHAFCNHMGFPHFEEVLNHPAPTRYYVAGAFAVGLLLWAALLFPLTEPSLYDNTMYYTR